jgi:hypothetical protein
VQEELVSSPDLPAEITKQIPQPLAAAFRLFFDGFQYFFGGVFLKAANGFYEGVAFFHGCYQMHVVSHPDKQQTFVPGEKVRAFRIVYFVAVAPADCFLP